MTGYAKLFQSIVTSSIWAEDDRTRIVWITLLAIADKHGEVHASIPGLARVAGVPVDACEVAIETFLGPDKYSRTPDCEGRRIERIDGGWAILNYGKYRRMASVDDEREKAAERKRRQRERDCHAPSQAVTGGHEPVTVETDNADADAGPPPELPVELPDWFPKTEREAVVHADFVGCPTEFAATEWHRAVGRGGRDSKDVPIRNWRSYLAAVWSSSKGRIAESKSKPVSAGHQSTAGRISREKQAVRLRDELAAHPGNPQSAIYHVDTTTETDRADFRAKRTRLRELETGGNT